MKRPCTVALILVAAASVRADGPGDNIPDKVRTFPPPGVVVPAADRAELEAGVAALGKEIEGVRVALKGQPALLDLLPDVEVYYNAVRYALTYNEFFGTKATPDAELTATREVAIAKALLHQGMERAAQLKAGQPAWTTATGLVVRGYVSKIDGSVQPYGLVVPASYRADSPFRHRLDFWCHGRNETLSELNFIDDRQKSPGEFTPRDAFVIHLYGRYCCANKFAGEVDLFEALENVKKHYPIDEDRLVVRGFSMGGAACWHFAVHYPTLWAAAAPGAGFAETADFLKVFQNEVVKPTEYERSLWRLYDCPGYAVNLFNCPTVAYSGAIDTQKQAADQMAVALAGYGLKLTHLIGPHTAHAYHPAAKAEISRRIDSIVGKGRERLPRHIRFATFTLRYNESAWVRIDGLGQHWLQATVDAAITGPRTVTVKTHNVTALTLTMPAGYCPLENVPDKLGSPEVTIDDTRFPAGSGLPPVASDRSWEVHLLKGEKGWIIAPDEDLALRKRHGLQGPIDDAFMDSFLMVRPTGTPVNEKVGAWVGKEMVHALDHWRKEFRGAARAKDDTEVNDADIAAHNLVLWGDPHSNKVLAKIAGKLPVVWDAEIKVGSKTYPASHHVPVLIYPNPLNPKRYVVLNSGFTFREYDYLNNARQVPKLPDYAVIDVDVPASSQAPGGIVTAGFFDEQWKFPPEGGKE